MFSRPRTVTPADTRSVLPLLEAAYGPNRSFESRYRTYTAVEPEGWVVVEGPSSLLGVGGFVAFGASAYIGLMAVAPEAQRRGVGASIFEELLARCDARGLSHLLLDASDAGAPLYERYGFRDFGTAQSFSIGPGAAARMAPNGSFEVRAFAPGSALESEVTRFDAMAYGADRSALVRHCLRDFSGRVLTAHAPSGALVGYSIGQPSSFGPCMAESADVARALLRAALALPSTGQVTWLVASQNREAVSLARAVAGEPTKTWRHMRRGAPDLAGDWSRLFAKKSLAVG